MLKKAWIKFPCQFTSVTPHGESVSNSCPFYPKNLYHNVELTQVFPLLLGEHVLLLRANGHSKERELHLAWRKKDNSKIVKYSPNCLSDSKRPTTHDEHLEISWINFLTSNTRSWQLSTLFLFHWNTLIENKKRVRKSDYCICKLLPSQLTQYQTISDPSPHVLAPFAQLPPHYEQWILCHHHISSVYSNSMACS